MSFSFLIQAARVLHVGNYDDGELKMIYDYIFAIDDEILEEYGQICTVLSYENDLYLLIEIIDAMILIYEEREEYEKCAVLKNKKDRCNFYINQKTI